MARTYTFLQLSQEFGGTRFGPFDGVEIRLGSDPGRSDITLPEGLGVAPEHVKILIQTDGSFIIAPVDRAAAVFHWRAGSNRSRQVAAPMAVQAGDGFSLGTAEGPRFFIQTVAEKQAKEAAAESEGPKFGRNLNSGGIFNEIKRRGLGSVLTSSGGRLVYNWWTFAKTGQMFAPTYVVAFLLLASGWVFAGGASCTAFNFNSTKGKTAVQLTNCRDQLGIGSSDEGGPTVPGLTRKILVDREWQTTIQADKDLYKAYADALRVIFAEPSRYQWAYTQKGGTFARYREALEATGMPPDLVRVMAYSAAMPGFGQARDWSLVEDSEDEEVCGRGPLALTYAQGRRLGLSNLQLDAMVERAVAQSNDLAPQKEALVSTASRIDDPTQFDEDLVKSAGAVFQGGVECLYVDGEDDRTNINLIAQRVQAELGASISRGLPREGEAHWIAARVTRLYAMDFRRGYDELDFDARQEPSTAMKTQSIKAGRAAYAIKAAGEVIARAVAIPCLATLDKEVSAKPPQFMGELPNLGHCAIVRAFVEYDRL